MGAAVACLIFGDRVRGRIGYANNPAPKIKPLRGHVQA